MINSHNKDDINYPLCLLVRPEEDEQPTPRQLEMLLEESGASSPDSGTLHPVPSGDEELEQLELLEKEMEEGEGGGQPLVRRSVSQAERRRLEQEMAELARLEAEILTRRSVMERESVVFSSSRKIMLCLTP